MKKYIVSIALWFIVVVIGFIVAFLYIINYIPSAHYAVFILSLVSLTVGLFFLYRLVSQESIYTLHNKDNEKAAKATGSTEGEQGFAGILQKNNEYLEEYDKVDRMRNKMQILKVAGAAEEHKDKS